MSINKIGILNIFIIGEMLGEMPEIVLYMYTPMYTYTNYSSRKIK